MARSLSTPLVYHRRKIALRPRRAAGEPLVPDAYSQLVTHRPFARPETVRTLLNLPRSGKNGLSISPRLHLSQASGWDKTTRQTPITWIRKVSENCLKPPYPLIEGAFGQMGPLHLKNLSHWRKGSAPPMISAFCRIHLIDCVSPYL